MRDGGERGGGMVERERGRNFSGGRVEDERQEEIRLGGCGIQRQYNDGSGGRGWELAAGPYERANVRLSVIKSLPYFYTK